MEPKIETLTEKKLIGKRVLMTLGNNKTQQLWQSFMPRHKEITNRVGTHLFSMQVYASQQNFANITLDTELEKWAAVEVSDFLGVPAEMETYTLPGGLYAVFNYKGLSTDPSIFHYIFGTWLPASGYTIDARPHFEILGEKYKNNDPNSEEEIWIPIKVKA